MADQIKVTETLAHLDKEMSAADPYILGLPGNKRITFEDFTAWTGERAAKGEEILQIAVGETDADLDVFAEKWLSTKDFAVWKAQGLSFRQKAKILQQASSHVLKGLSPGESSASASS